MIATSGEWGRAGSEMGGIIITATLLVLGVTLALLLLEPIVRPGILKFLLFASYTVMVTVYGLQASLYGRDMGLAAPYSGAIAVMITAATIYTMIASFSRPRRDGHALPEPETETREHGTQVQTNYVPAIPPVRRKYRSMTKRTLNAVKAHKPREHWKVAE